MRYHLFCFVIGRILGPKAAQINLRELGATFVCLPNVMQTAGIVGLLKAVTEGTFK